MTLGMAARGRVFRLFGSLSHLAGGVSVYTANNFFDRRKNSLLCDDSSSTPHPLLGARIPTYPSYTFAEIAKHRTKNVSVWVTYKQGVYDITSFVEKHPGGDKIMLGAGGPVDPYWRLFNQHESLPHIGHMLEEMRVGNVDEGEWLDMQKRHDSNQSDTTNPYRIDDSIDRHPGLVFLSKRPANAETSPILLPESFITSNELFFVRHHFPVPDANAQGADLLTVGLEKGEETATHTPHTSQPTLTTQPTPTESVHTVQSLSSLFNQHTVIATIQCTGNRRTGFNAVKNAPGQVKGLPWTVGAISTAKWTGPRLRDIILDYMSESSLRDAGIQHVHFWGRDTDGSGQYYGVSIPIDRALDIRSDVLVALKMNDQPLPLDHGAPMRIIVPGAAGCRSVKWVSRIELSKNESNAFWQKEDYKSFSPSQGWVGLDFSTAPAVMSTPVQSAVCDAVIDGDYVTAKGYAFSGGGNRIIRVDVSVDGGTTWEVAELEGERDDILDQNNIPYRRTYSWSLWKAVVARPQDPTSKLSVIVKATDESYNSQPESPASIWNVRGILNNAWHKYSIG